MSSHIHRVSIGVAEERLVVREVVMELIKDGDAKCGAQATKQNGGVVKREPGSKKQAGYGG